MIFQGWSILIYLAIFVLAACAVVFGIVYHDGDQQILQLLILGGIVIGIVDRQFKHSDTKTTEKRIETKVDENTDITKIIAESNPDSSDDLRKHMEKTDA